MKGQNFLACVYLIARNFHCEAGGINTQVEAARGIRNILHTNINNMALFADSGFLGNGRLWAESQAAPAVEYTKGLQIMLLP